MLQLRTITDSGHLQSVRQIYTTSFPAAEQRPWSRIVAPTDSAGPQLLGIYDTAVSDEPLGLVTLWLFDTFNYIEHFAIDPRRRSGGIGGVTLGLIADTYPHPTVVEVEKPDEGPEAVRRIGFYERNGYAVLSEDYIQPPYSDGLPSVPLTLMMNPGTGGAPLPDADHVAHTLHTRVYLQPQDK